MRVAATLTYDDLVTLPEDGKRYEILDGELAAPLLRVSGHGEVYA